MASARRIDPSNDTEQTREGFFYFLFLNWAPRCGLQSLWGNVQGIKCSEDKVKNRFDLKDFKVWVARPGHNFINNGMRCVTGPMLLTLVDRREDGVCAWSDLRIISVSGWLLREFSNVDCRDCVYVSIVSVKQRKSDQNRLTLLRLFLSHWPGSRSSHTGRHGRCPDGSEVTSGFHHFEPEPPQSTCSAGEPGQTTGCSGTPLSRSEDLTHPRTACDLPQQLISWAQSGRCSAWGS